MTWGLPPKFRIIVQFDNIAIDVIQQSVINSLINEDFEIKDNQLFYILAEKKMRITFLSFFAFSRPRIVSRILLTKNGRITIDSAYTYNSMTGIAMNDSGNLKKNIDSLLTEIKYIVPKNDEFAKYGTVDGAMVSE